MVADVILFIHFHICRLVMFDQHTNGSCFCSAIIILFDVIYGVSPSLLFPMIIVLFTVSIETAALLLPLNGVLHGSLPYQRHGQPGHRLACGGSPL